MAKLIVENGETTRSYELSSACMRIGRNPDNDILLDHDSVSGSHAELIQEKGAFTLHDRGSTNGTFVDGHAIESVALEDGQIVRFGDVEARFSRSQLGVVRVVTPAPAVTAAAAQSVSGTSAAPSHVCENCASRHSEADANRRVIGGKVVLFCPECGGRCETLADVAERSAPKREVTFTQELGNSFKYPFRGDGPFLLITGTIFFAILESAGFLFFSIIIAVLGGGYLVHFFKDVVANAARGDSEPPGWPDVTEIWNDVVGPYIQFLGLSALCFGPGLVWLAMGPETGKTVIGWSLIVLGFAYFPMSLLAVSLFDSLFSLNPILILNSISRILPHYLVVLVFLVLVGGIRELGFRMTEILSVPVLPWLVAEFVSLYVLIVTARTLGMMYHVNRRKLNWY
jgi:prepilin-type processing-associated H-X9-DG protein